MVRIGLSRLLNCMIILDTSASENGHQVVVMFLKSLAVQIGSVKFEDFHASERSRLLHSQSEHRFLYRQTAASIVLTLN